MKKIILWAPAMCCLLGFAAAIRAQDYEYGQIDDLKGLATYCVDTGPDVKMRERIIHKIGKELPDIVRTVDDCDKAAIRLTFGTGPTQTAVTGVTLVGQSAIVGRKTMRTGGGIVSIDARGEDKSRPRLILNFSSRQDNKMEALPADKFASAFIKAYKKANGLK